MNDRKNDDDIGGSGVHKWIIRGATDPLTSYLPRCTSYQKWGRDQDSAVVAKIPSRLGDPGNL